MSMAFSFQTSMPDKFKLHNVKRQDSTLHYSFLFLSCMKIPDMKKAVLLSFISFWSILNLYGQQRVMIKDGTIITTSGKVNSFQADILIEGNKIVSVQPNMKIPDNSTVIDASGKYIIPGLTDAHIHFFQSGGLYTRPDAIDLRYKRSYEDEMKWIKANVDDLLMRYIRCGITTVVDLGGHMWNFDVRSHAAEKTLAPRVFLCGPLIASYQPAALTTDDPPIIKVNSVEEALGLVHQQVEKNTDFIKIWYVAGRGVNPEEFEPIVKAIINESHKLGKKVYVHAYELDETVKRALKAGADVLVHSVRDKKVDEEFLRLMKKNKVSYIPTLWVFNSYQSVFKKQLDLLPEEHLLGNPEITGSLFEMYETEPDRLPERILKMQADTTKEKPSPVILENLKAVQQAGINVVAGTDAGNIGVLHGPSLFHEFMLMKQAGLTNREILISATLNAARMLGQEKLLGSVEASKLADLVVLNANPLDNIMNTSKIHLVIKDGHIFYPDSILRYSPEDLARIQLNAYNEKDLDAFLSVYSDSIEIYNFPDELRIKGKEEMRKLYADFFSRAGNLHCQILDRISYKQYIFDKELINTDIPGRERFEGQAIYEIKEGKIVKVWFVK